MIISKFISNEFRHSSAKNSSGVIIVLVAISLATAVVFATFLWHRVADFFYRESLSQLKEEALAIAEGGVDAAVWNLNGNSLYAGETGLPVGDGEVDIVVATIDGNSKLISATSYIPSASNPIVQKTVEVEVLRSASIIGFPYGLQAGDGGLDVGDGVSVQGSVYSNGDVSVGSNSDISGSAWVAAGSTLSGGASFETNDSNEPFSNLSSGRDMAQSFVLNTNMTINSIELYLKKTGSPPNLGIHILADDGGKPGLLSTHLVANGSVHNSWITTELSWISVALQSNPTLTAGQTYWLVVNGGANTSNYYHWGSDSGLGYPDGVAMQSPNVNTGGWTPVNKDMNFRLEEQAFVAGFIGSSGTTVGGDLYSNGIDTVTIGGGAYYQTIANATASAYYPGSTDPPSINFPVSDAQITDWKNEAEAAGTIASTCNGTLGPGKITGDVLLGTTCVLTLTGTVWIEGDLVVVSGGVLQLDSSYGANGGVVIVSGRVYVAHGGELKGSGEGDSYLLVISEFSETTDHAIHINNNNITEGILFAPYGRVFLGNTSQVLEVTGYHVVIDDNNSLIYETGLSNAAFLGGSSSMQAWSVRDGTWQEVN